MAVLILFRVLLKNTMMPLCLCTGYLKDGHVHIELREAELFRKILGILEPEFGAKHPNWVAKWLATAKDDPADD